MIYLDNAATTKVLPSVAEAVHKALTENYANPSAQYRFGLDAELEMARVKDSITAILGEGAVLFTSGATEANNQAIFGLAKTYGRRKKRIVVTAIEHPSVLSACMELKNQGFEVVLVQPENHEITAQAIISAVDDNTCLVSAMLVNNETGLILPIKEAFSAIKRKFPDCITHTDCVQGFLKLPILYKTLNADAISISGHKVHAPKGVGALWVKKGVRIAPIIHGGGQQNALRSGTEPTPLIFGFGEAIKVLSKDVKERFEKVTEINAYARKKLLEIGCTINSNDFASPYILSFSVGVVKSETMLHFLDSQGVCVSAGSACSKGKKSEVLQALNHPADTTLRVSFTASTTQDEIDALVQGVAKGLETLAKIR